MDSISPATLLFPSVSLIRLTRTCKAQDNSVWLLTRLSFSSAICLVKLEISAKVSSSNSSRFERGVGFFTLNLEMRRFWISLNWELSWVSWS